MDEQPTTEQSAGQKPVAKNKLIRGVNKVLERVNRFTRQAKKPLDRMIRKRDTVTK